jgi:hypothetical protein
LAFLGKTQSPRWLDNRYRNITILCAVNSFGTICPLDLLPCFPN